MLQEKKILEVYSLKVTNCEIQTSVIPSPLNNPYFPDNPKVSARKKEKKNKGGRGRMGPVGTRGNGFKLKDS